MSVYLVKTKEHDAWQHGMHLKGLENIQVSCEVTLGKALAEVVSWKMLGAQVSKLYYH